MASIRILGPADPYIDPSSRSALTYGRDGPVEIMYAPFDHVSTRAKLAIIGITPGRAPAIRALRAAQHKLLSGSSTRDALRAAKFIGSFSSPGTRQNLVRMMDEIKLNDLFGIGSTHELFVDEDEPVHFTSALRYPVFVNGANYKGQPDMLKVPMLRSLIETFLAEEAAMLRNAVWLPLGPKPAIALRHLASLGILRSEQILDGIPHPSGANSERVAAFLGTKADHQWSKVTNAERISQAKAILMHKIDLLRRIPRA